MSSEKKKQKYVQKHFLPSSTVIKAINLNNIPRLEKKIKDGLFRKKRRRENRKKKVLIISIPNSMTKILPR